MPIFAWSLQVCFDCRIKFVVSSCSLAQGNIRKISLFTIDNQHCFCGLSPSFPITNWSCLEVWVIASQARHILLKISLKVGRRVRDIDCGEEIEVLDPLNRPNMLFCLSRSVPFVFLPHFQKRLVFTVFSSTFLCISCFPVCLLAKEGVRVGVLLICLSRLCNTALTSSPNLELDLVHRVLVWSKPISAQTLQHSF